MHLAYSAIEVEKNDKKITTQLGNNCEKPKWMEEYTIFIDQKAQYYKDDSVPKFDLQKSVQAKAKPLLFYSYYSLSVFVSILIHIDYNINIS